ncbi:MAG: DUF1559 domain-containing protein [Planctomycetota bacterium]
MNSRSRSGFTLVELLVVIAIIGILIALLLPAVQAAREESRRAQCSNNMKQLGLALHNYHDAHKAFPYAVAGGGSFTAGTATPASGRVLNHKGWLLVLPFFEQQALHDQVNFNVATGGYDRGGKGYVGGLAPGAAGNTNDIISGTSLNAFLCPSDANPTHYTNPNSPHYSISPGTTTQLGAYTNYDFSVRRSSSWANTWARDSKRSRRMFGPESSGKFRDITDGTSNVVAVCETLRSTWNGVSQTWAYAKWVGNGVDLQYSRGINFNLCCAWDSPPFQRAGARSSRLGDWSTAGSLHPGGAQFTLGDGSVRFISETTNQAVLNRLAYIADGNPVGNF